MIAYALGPKDSFCPQHLQVAEDKHGAGQLDCHPIVLVDRETEREGAREREGGRERERERERHVGS